MISIRALRNYFYAYLPRVSPLWYAAALLLGAAVFVTQIYIMKKRQRGWNGGGFIRVSARAFCAAYILMLFAALVSMRRYGVRGYNLKPFWSYQAIAGGDRDLFYVVLFNVLLFLPYGFAAGMASLRNAGEKRVSGLLRPFITVTLSGAVISLAIELLQFRLNRGYAEFDDIFHNTLGTAIGCAVAYAVIKTVAAWQRHACHSNS